VLFTYIVSRIYKTMNRMNAIIEGTEAKTILVGYVKIIRISYNIERVAKEIENSELLDVFAQILRTGIDVI